MLVGRQWKRIAAMLLSMAVLGFQTVEAQECKKPKVFFVNGVFNQQWEAQDASRKLEAAITANGGPAGLHIATLYNPTDPGLGDALEIAQDYVLAGKHLTAAWWIAYAADFLTPPLTPPLLLLLLNQSGDKTYLGWLNSQIDGTAAALRNAAVVEKIRLALLNTVKDQKTPVIAIAHSEGNFYLNEAIRRLKTDSDTKDIPGIQAIGVLGIGVASRLNLASLPSGQRFYSYVTKSDDAIIVPLQNVLPANFTSVVDPRITSHSATGHELITDYLYGNVLGNYKGAVGVSIRNVIAQEFTAIYDATSSSYPCINSISASPNPVIANQPVTFSAKAISRVGAPLTAGALEFGNGDSAFCAAVVNTNGVATCSITFGARPVPAKLFAQWSTGVFKSNAESVDLTATRGHWYGTFTYNYCQDPPPGTLYFWERPCFNLGVTDGQFSSTFRFADPSGPVMLESDAFSRIRKVYNTTWSAVDMTTLTLSMPTEVLVPAPFEQRFVRYSGTRVIELTVVSRSSDQISGTFEVRSSSGAAVDITPTYPGNVVAPFASKASGTWVARLQREPMPATQMKGFDLCYSDNGALNYRNLDQVRFDPGNGNWYTSLGSGAVGGICVYQ